MSHPDTPADQRERHWYDVRQYALIINDDLEALLLQLPAHYGADCGSKWVLPGGKLRPDESPDQSLLREITEETGLTVELTDILTAATWHSTNATKYGTFWLAYVTGGTVKLSDEHQAYRWVPLSTAPKESDLFLPLINQVWQLAHATLSETN